MVASEWIVEGFSESLGWAKLRDMPGVTDKETAEELEKSFRELVCSDFPTRVREVQYD